MADHLVGTADQRRPRRRRLARGAGGLALAAGAGAGGFFAVAGGAATATSSSASARLSVVARSSLRRIFAVVGTVESLNTAANSFTVKDESGTTTTVTVSSATTYRDPGPDTASLRNVTVGEHVAVLGTTSAGAVRATSVLIGVPHHDGGWEKGAGLLPAGPGRGSPGPAA